MPKVSIEGLDRTIVVPAGANLREALLDAGVTLYPFVNAVFNCRGEGLLGMRCGSCRVKVLEGEGNLSPRTTAEVKELSKRPDLRLACQVVVRGDCRVLTLP